MGSHSWTVIAYAQEKDQDGEVLTFSCVREQQWG